MTGLEPATLGTTNRCSNQLSYNRRIVAANIQQTKISFYIFLQFFQSRWFSLNCGAV